MISVLMTTYNKAFFLNLTLAAYVKQSYKEFELVIVDDGSTDNTKTIVEKYSSLLNIKYLYQTNMGISKAKRRALENASYDYVILTDDDRMPCIDFVKQHKERLEREGKCVVIGKECLILSHFSRNVRYSFKDEFKIYDRFPELLHENEKQMFDEKDIDEDYYDVIRKFYLSDNNSALLLDVVEQYGEQLDGFELAWSKAYGGNLSFNKAFLTAPLLYDENYKGYGIEDIDFAYQLFLQGYKFRFDSKGINYHQEHARGMGENRDMFQNFDYFCNKYTGIDILMMKMDWYGKITLDEANIFCKILKKYKDELEQTILYEINEKV